MQYVQSGGIRKEMTQAGPRAVRLDKAGCVKDKEKRKSHFTEVKFLYSQPLEIDATEREGV